MQQNLRVQTCALIQIYGKRILATELFCHRFLALPCFENGILMQICSLFVRKSSVTFPLDRWFMIKLSETTSSVDSSQRYLSCREIFFSNKWKIFLNFWFKAFTAIWLWFRERYTEFCFTQVFGLKHHCIFDDELLITAWFSKTVQPD